MNGTPPGTRGQVQAALPHARRDANRLDWAGEVAPAADVAVPDGMLPVRMANAQRTSAGICAPGQMVTLPHDEARALLREGAAREVRVTAGAGLPRSSYTDPRTEFRARPGPSP